MAEAARAVRSQMEAAMKVACAEGIIIALPALPGPPPRRDAPPQELARFEDGALQLASIAALSGVPQACVSLATGAVACRQHRPPSVKETVTSLDKDVCTLSMASSRPDMVATLGSRRCTDWVVKGPHHTLVQKENANP